jgi:hypothetical protein
LVGLFVVPEDAGDVFLQNVSSTSALHGVISLELFITIAVSTSNPTKIIIS